MDFTHNSPASHVVVGEDEFEKDEQTFSEPFFSVRASEVKSFARVENGVLVSLGNKGTGVSQLMKKILSGSSSLKNSVSQSVGSTDSSS